jgi:hypothetical protein
MVSSCVGANKEFVLERAIVAELGLQQCDGPDTYSGLSPLLSATSGCERACVIQGFHQGLTPSEGPRRGTA